MQLSKKVFILISIAFILSSCASFDTSTRPPEVNEFPDVSLDYEVIGSREENRAITIQFLSQKGIPYRQEIQEPHTYVITAYLMEPEQESARRIQRTAYRISLRDSSQKNVCTYISLTWLVQSKGIRERTWRTVQSDAMYTPSNLEEVKQLFSGRLCK